MKYRYGKSVLPVIVLLVLVLCKLHVEAGMGENPYISYSPDGEAYSIDAGVADTEWYEFGKVVSTDMKSQLDKLKVGEHYYEYAVTGEVPVGYWKVMLSNARCIHNTYIDGDVFHGVTFGKRKCLTPYFSGWMPYCANCGEQVASRFHYMSEAAARSTRWIDVSKAYFYKCPHCDNLEQAVEQHAHICKAVSANRYFVNYLPNEGNGYMGRSAHIYNNSHKYEGREVTPQTCLSLNTFTRIGYVFVGWNTMPDGSGTCFADGEEILNMSDKEGGEIVLYAQWKKCQSQLCIDPNGGKYNGSSKITVISGAYGELYELQNEMLQPPKGNVVHFNTGKGAPLKDIVGEKRLKEWSMKHPFYGKLTGTCYSFPDVEGANDCVTALYEDLEIILPQAFREGYSFGGWYLDKECTQLVGSAGSKLVPVREMTLYAGWVNLQLVSEDNYLANEGKGAVDLSWSQKDNDGKVYLVYQRTEGEDWKQIESKEVSDSIYEVDKTIEYSKMAESFTIPYSGFYQITLYGAQGGHYGNCIGGKGEKVDVGIYLEKGERLHCYIGGQSGFPGGGTGLMYGNGGGYSMLSSEKKGLLMMAGGGGGATELENGLPGGSHAGVVNTQEGESGISGGGGGYYGGRAGDVIKHYHDMNCKHIHVGKAEEYGGCYTLPVYCNNKEFEKKEKSRKFYYGNIDDYGNHIFCVRCGSDYCPGHLDIKYDYECVVCGKKYDSEIDYCIELVKYELSCGRNENYVCGFTEGEVLSTKAAYGGAGYVNTNFCYSYIQQAGVRNGNGLLRLVSKIVGTVSDEKLDGVAATDLACPDIIDVSTVKKVAVGMDEMRISFKKPKDNGTKYYHQVKSVDSKTNQIICSSNETVNTLTTGVKGYLYVLDYLPDTVVDNSADYYEGREEEPFFVVNVKEQVQYLHIAPVDKAENVGETLHIRISKEDVTYWPLMTEKLVMREDMNVAQAELSDYYYVRADGFTPFEVEAEAYICGIAGVGYQIDYTNVLSGQEGTGEESIYSVITPRKSGNLIGTSTYPMQQLQKKTWGEAYVQDAGYTVTQRFNNCKNIKLIQQFTIERQYHGCTICLMPQAGAQTKEGTIYSERENDVKNCICLIADGKGPEISGLDSLNEVDCLDFSKEEGMQIHIEAKDADSGLDEFYVEIYNMENGSLLRYEDKTLSGKIDFEITADHMVFNGKFSVLVYSRDRVGNESIEGKDLLGIGLYAYVERVLEPHDEAFKRGETGILHIQTTGYVERVEVFFQQDLLQQGSSSPIVYVYEVPEYMQTEQKEFMIPLDSGDGEKSIKVVAYKAGTELEKEPQLIVIQVKGSILDELRTRLR